MIATYEIRDAVRLVQAAQKANDPSALQRAEAIFAAASVKVFRRKAGPQRPVQLEMLLPIPGGKRGAKPDADEHAA